MRNKKLTRNLIRVEMVWINRIIQDLLIMAQESIINIMIRYWICNS
jgi:hypothetical protein